MMLRPTRPTSTSTTTAGQTAHWNNMACTPHRCGRTDYGLFLVLFVRALNLLLLLHRQERRFPLFPQFKAVRARPIIFRQGSQVASQTLAFAKLASCAQRSACSRNNSVALTMGCPPA